MLNTKNPFRYLSRRRFVTVTTSILVLALLNFVFDAILWTESTPVDQRFADPKPFAGVLTEHAGERVYNVLAVQRDILDHASPTMQAASVRLSAHRSATEYVEKLSFYDDGWGMVATPTISEFYHRVGCDQGWKGYIIREFAKPRLGLYSGRNTATGFLDKSHADLRVVVTGCATCHFGRAAGKDIPGLGNKNIDPCALGQWINAADGTLSWLPIASSTRAARDIQARSLAMARRLGNEGLSNTTQGMVPVSLVFRWFYEQQGVPIPPTMTPGAVKVPTLWGYAEKISSGIFCDGVGDGEHSAWAAMVELAAGNSVENIRNHIDQIEYSELALGSLLPPAYPNSIDWEGAENGKSIFVEHCQVCHGQYVKDYGGLSIYEKPIHVRIEDVGTDDDRLNIVTVQSIEMVSRSPLKDVIRTHPHYRRGYFAPRLDGIWARFPYLHNGSVPNIMALLSNFDERPVIFDLSDAGEVRRYDSENLGLNVPLLGSAKSKQLQVKARTGSREVYDTSQLGHSNRGHEFGTDLSTEMKRSLIEYLKTL